jgi:hypothetical protein
MPMMKTKLLLLQASIKRQPARVDPVFRVGVVNVVF